MGSKSGNRLSPYSTPSATREVLERHGLYTKYGLGQNFLVNDDVIRKILELADVQPTDRVLEVGPGIGTLAAALLQRAAHVTAIEKDADLPIVLADTLSPWADRFTLVSADALDISEHQVAGNADFGVADSFHGETDVAETETSFDGDNVSVVSTSSNDASAAATDGLLDDASDVTAGALSDSVSAAAAEGLPYSMNATVTEGSCSASDGKMADGLCGIAHPGMPNKLVSNLPYAVAATVVLDYLQRFDFLESLTVMVQKEVADRMTARPGTKTYGAYTVKLSLYAQAAGRFSVAPGNFFPPPHVESAVLRLDRVIARGADGQSLAPELLAATCKMADAAFATRRKTLANSCKTYFAGDPHVLPLLPRIFEQAGIDPRRRGETLTQEEFINLGTALLACE